MKNHIRKNGVYNLLTLIIVLGLSTIATASDDGYALLIQSSPPNGGSVSPGAGVHKINIGQEVALSAVPKQGYRFLYWLGDVSSTNGPDTTVSLNSPKLVVAVFAREGFDEELPGAGIPDGQYGPGGGRFYNPIQSPGSVSPGVAPFDFESPNFTVPDISDEEDPFVPGDENADDGEKEPFVPGDNQVPEPSTILLLGIGSSVLLRKKK